MSRKSIMLALFLCLAVSTLGFAKGKPATEPGDDRGGNNPGVGVDDNHNHRQRGKTPPGNRFGSQRQACYQSPATIAAAITPEPAWTTITTTANVEKLLLRQLLW